MNDVSASPKRLRQASGVFFFLAFSGLIPFLARYGVLAQWILLLHIAVGVLVVAPFTLIFWKHGRVANASEPTRWWSAGLWAGVGWALLGVSGLWLVGKGIWGVFVPYRMHYVHVVAGIVFGTIGLLHIGYGVVKSRTPQGRYGQVARPLALWGIILIVGSAGILFARRQKILKAADFRPSNARTTTGRVIPAELMGNSESCGTSGCHSAIYQEWAPGAHRYSAIDPFYQAIKTNYIHDRGPDSPRYCAGCHEPLPLVAGEHILAKTGAGGSEGSSCVFCHALRETETRGNANYAVRPPDRYLFELSHHPALRQVANMLIRLHPEQHALDYDVKPSQTAEFCGTCHKQYINKEENGWGFVQLQDQYDDWKNGPWHTDPRRSLQCQDCHMHEVASDDPARNARGFTHDHRILASNNYVPEMLNLLGAKKQIELVNEWISGQAYIPEIAKVWPSGPIVPVHLETEGTIAPGRPVTVRALVTNSKVGHAFPTGPLDVIEVWLEFQVSDARGQTVYSAGTLAPNGSIQGDTIEYRAYLLDKNAQPVFTHALWNVVGARDKRVLSPGGSDTTVFQFTPPRNASGPLHCELRLLYRKFNYQTQSVLFASGNAPKIPIIEISKATLEIPYSSQSKSDTNSSVIKGISDSR